MRFRERPSIYFFAIVCSVFCFCVLALFNSAHSFATVSNSAPNSASVTKSSTKSSQNSNTEQPASATAPELEGVGIFEKLGEQVSIQDLKFQNEKGESVTLSKYFESKKPVLLTLVYYECPNLCNFMLNGLTDSLREFPWTPGKEFELVTVSINPSEKPALAEKKKASYLKAYGRPEAASGWHFLTGEESSIKKLASEVGFGYRYDDQEKQYAHSAALFILTPEGKISRYLYGIQYEQQDMKLALLEASNGRIGTIVDRFLLFCYRYDPKTRKYSLFLTKLMQAGAAGTTVVFGGYLAVFWRRQRRRQDKA